MSKLKEFSRRGFLRGAGKFTLPLPVLNLFLNTNGNAYANGLDIQPTFLYCLNGLASGCGGGGTNINLTNDGYTFGKNWNSSYDVEKRVMFHPEKFGRDYKMRGSLVELAAYKQDFNIITNLSIGHGIDTPGAFPKLGKNVSHHSVVQWGLLTGNGKYELTGRTNTDGDVERSGTRRSKTMTTGDYAVFNHFERKGKRMHLHVEKQRYNSGAHGYVSMENGDPDDPLRELSDIFNQLFGNAAALQARTVNGKNSGVKLRQSVVDLVLEDFKGIKCLLGKEDCITLDSFLAKMQDVQKEVNDLETDDTVSVQCKAPSSPQLNDTPQGSNNYGQEMKRAKLINEMIAMGAACGVSHVYSYGITHSRSGLYPQYFTDFVSNPGYDNHQGTKDGHALTHDGHVEAVTTAIEFYRWQNSVYGDLIKNFKNIKVGDGTLLDYSNLLYFVEGGYGAGFDSSSKWTPHSLQNMVAMNAGGSKLGIKLGQHINGKGVHPMKVMTTAMNSMKMSNPKVGEVSGVISDIL